ncbi:MAG: hypothetical protein ACREYF_23240 [Gammaproteobacteria bacterium]
MTHKIRPHIQGPGDYALEVVGEVNYQDALSRLCGGRTKNGHFKEMIATLIHEDDNPYDSKAIRIEIENVTIGYLNRKDARAYRRQLKKRGYPGLTVTCDAMIRGGWKRGFFDRGDFGVVLDLPVERI